jgi:hypothetical protein
VTIGAAQQFFLGASKATGGGAAGYQIERSLRFNSSDTANLSRVFGASGNRKTWTWSGWLKRSKLSTDNYRIFNNSAPSPTNATIVLTSNDNIRFFDTLISCNLQSTAVFRDASAWYHILVNFDTTQATASNRVKIYINGSQITTFSAADYPSQNIDGNINNNVNHVISGGSDGVTEYLNGYLADIHFIDGQALTPSSFTEVSATTGQLIPLAYSGTYGTNGFQLKFADNSAATAATLGADTSGNGNNWTPNNLSTSTGGPTSVAAASGALPVFNTTDTYGTVKGTGTRTDTNSASIVLALPMDGTNGGTSFGDQSAVIKGSGSAKTVTVNGNSNTSTAQSKFYGSSGLFDGTGDFLGITPTTDFALPGDFTIEAWMYSALSANNAIFSIGSYTSGLYFRTGEGGDLTKITIFINNSQVALSASGAIKASQWTHVTVVRAGSTVTIYVNGVSVVSGTSSFSIPSDTTYVGRAVHSTGEDMNGYLQDVRVYKGVAKYTSNFNPPSATANATVAAGNDSLVDTPTSIAATDTGVGGEIRGNYATFNALALNGNTLSNGNLDYLAGSANKPTLATIGIPNTGKWYFEFTDVDSTGSFTAGVGSASVGASSYLGADANGWGYQTHPSNAGYHNSGVFTTTGRINGAGSNTILGVAIDRDTQKIWFSVNGTYVNSGVPASGTNAQYSNLPSSGELFPGASTGSSQNIVFNAGQRAFAYTAPSGFKALCDTNLGAPLVAKPNTLMDVALWTGTGVGARAITGLNFNPDLVWLKRRSSTGTSNQLHDVVRTASAGALYSDLTNAEDSNYPLTSFDTAGFTLGSSASLASQSYASQNETSQTYVGWTWDAGTSTVTNTAGSITSQVRANVSAGFSICTFSIVSASATISTFGHGLGVAPSFVIFKVRNAVDEWTVYHGSISSPTSNWVTLNTTNAAGGGTSTFSTSSTTFGVRETRLVASSGSGNILAYCFAPVDGYSSFGSYVGNGSSDGPMVWTGFRPRYILIKCSDTSAALARLIGQFTIHPEALSMWPTTMYGPT